MKNQYFGDINDYRKYGLLRSIIRASDLRTVICWMLTPDDDSRDGRFVDYLERPEKWARHDPQLYDTLRSLLKKGSVRAVSLLEDTPLLPKATFFSDEVPDNSRLRDLWFDRLLTKAGPHSVVFLDPDNGIEIPSCSYGRKGSAKYVYWREVIALWDTGSSLLIYLFWFSANWRIPPFELVYSQGGIHHETKTQKLFSQREGCHYQAPSC